MKKVEQNELITIKEAAELCGVPPKRLSKYRKQLPGFPDPVRVTNKSPKGQYLGFLYEKNAVLKCFNETNVIQNIRNCETEANLSYYYKKTKRVRKAIEEETNEYGYLHYRLQPWPTLFQRACIDKKTMVKFLCGRMY